MPMAWNSISSYSGIVTPAATVAVSCVHGRRCACGWRTPVGRMPRPGRGARVPDTGAWGECESLDQVALPADVVAVTLMGTESVRCVGEPHRQDVVAVGHPVDASHATGRQQRVEQRLDRRADRPRPRSRPPQRRRTAWPSVSTSADARRCAAQGSTTASSRAACVLRTGPPRTQPAPQGGHDREAGQVFGRRLLHRVNQVGARHAVRVGCATAHATLRRAIASGGRGSSHTCRRRR